MFREVNGLCLLADASRGPSEQEEKAGRGLSRRLSRAPSERVCVARSAAPSRPAAALMPEQTS